MDTKEREAKFSKNMSTINYWLSQQNFVNYDSLFWEKDELLGVTCLYFQEGKPVAKVEWFTLVKDNVDYHIPMFTFLGTYSDWNKNQITFWIMQKLNLILQEF